MTHTDLLTDLRSGLTVQLPLDQLSDLLSSADHAEVLQIVTLVTKGNAYLQLYRQIQDKSFQNN